MAPAASDVVVDCRQSKNPLRSPAVIVSHLNSDCHDHMRPVSRLEALFESAQFDM
ncbi:hypothetical protein [Methylotuvimicrobium sp. KM1]|uniref:hypothetical protein n=1 Tax=Methylotuvimicrobium sp. KM1 TaxID=3377707 RepID=UPI00384AE2CD